MKSKKQMNEPTAAFKKSAPVKTLNLQVAISEPDLPKAVREAFDLAKSAGRELNLVFNLPPDIGTTHLALPRLSC
jgi:sugar/nucleoside kinase (ribokinase family)